MASNTENKGAMSAKAALQANSIFCVSVAIGTPTVNIIVHHKKGANMIIFKKGCKYLK